jgi:hypothetical protein
MEMIRVVVLGQLQGLPVEIPYVTILDAVRCPTNCFSCGLSGERIAMCDM